MVGSTEFDEFAALHYRDAVGEIADNRHGVRDKQIRQTELTLQSLHEVDDLCADGDVKGRDRFVGNDEARAKCERASDANALALAATEFVRIARERGFVEPDSAH